MVMLGQENGKTELAGFSFGSFVSNEESFELTCIDEDRALDEPFTIEGQVYKDKILFLLETDDESQEFIQIWFIRSEKLEQYRKTAFEYIEGIGN